MREKAPAYQRYPKQIMGDDKVLLMDWDAYGMHNWLLDISWQQNPRGTIPDDTDALRRWLRHPDEETWRRVWPQLKASWPILDGSQRRFNAGMMRCAEKQENYSRGNSGKEKYANGTQIGTQIERDLPRKSTEVEEEVVKKLFVLPDWISKNVWEEFETMRKKIRKPMTDRARQLIVGELKRLKERGFPSDAVLEQSIVAGWSDVYELKTRRGSDSPIAREPGRSKAPEKCGWCGRPTPCLNPECEARDAEVRTRHAAHA